MRKALVALIAISLVWALTVALTGGFDLRAYGIPFKSTDADRPSFLALALIVLYILAYRDQTRVHITGVEARALAGAERLELHAGALVLALSAVVVSIGVVYGVHVAGGSDSYGYISQANLWIAGDLVVDQPLARQVPWPDAPSSLAPIGYRPTADGSGMVPTYSYGLPVLMAVAKLIAGMCGLYLVTPLLGGVMVGMTYVLGRQVWSSGVGLAAASLMATSPTFVFMQINPMSDVPASALFTAALVVSVRRSRWAPFWTGMIASLAIFVRPNVVLLGAVFAAWFLARADGGKERSRALALFVVGGLPLAAVTAITNALLHGAPWNTGYGSLDMYYAWEYLVPNVRQYSRVLVETETFFVLLFAVPLLVLRRLDDERRARVLFIAIFGLASWACYLFYTPYDAWWYLRFFLPAFPPMLVLAVLGFRQLLTRLPDGRRVLVTSCAVAAVLALRVQWIQSATVLRLWESGVEYTSAAEYIRTKLPPNAVILTVQHSGSVRYYADRPTVRWDWIGAEWWSRALTTLTDLGYRPYLLVSGFEEMSLRQQFGFGGEEDSPGTIVADLPDLRLVLYDPLRQQTGPRAVIPKVVSCPCQGR